MAGKTVHSKVVVSAKDDVSKTLKQLETRFKAFSRTAKHAVNSIKGLAKVSLAPLAGGLGAAAAAARSALFAFSDYGTSIDNTSRSLGVAANALQSFRYAATLGGSSAEEMDAAIAMLNKNIANAAAGNNKQLVKLMSDLGISMRKANGEMKTAAELMPEIADCIRSQSNATQRAYIATQFFGRSGQNLIKTLQEGSEGLNNMRKEAEHFGVVLSDDDAIEGVQYSIGRQLLPIMQPMLDDMNEWIAENREWIATEIVGSVKDFADSLKTIDFKSLVKEGMNFVKTCNEIFKAMGGLKTVGLIVAGIFASKVLIGIVSTVSAIGTMVTALRPLIATVWAFNTALWANPLTWIIVAIIAAIAALGAAIYFIYKYWDDIVAYFSDLWEQVKTIFTDFQNWVSEQWEGLKQTFSEIGDFFVEVWDSASTGAINIFDSFVKFFTETIPNAIKSVWEGVKKWFLDLIDTMMAPVQGVIDVAKNIGGSVKNGVSKAWDGVTSFFGFGNKEESTQAQMPSAKPVAGLVSGLSSESRFNGALDIRVHSDSDARAEVETKSDNPAMAMSVQQNRGASR
jgi:hypothetical protein